MPAASLLYALLGMAGAWAGRSLAQTGLSGKAQGILMMGAGLLILVLGLRMLLARPRRPALAPTGGLEVRLEPMTRAARPLPHPARRWRPARRAWSLAPRGWLLLFGTLNGLIPCSLVFSIALKAAATGDPGRAGLLMLAFGLGTLPMMAAVTGFGAFVGARTRDLSARIAGGLVAILGLWTLYEGYSFFDIMRGLGQWLRAARLHPPQTGENPMCDHHHNQGRREALKVLGALGLAGLGTPVLAANAATIGAFMPGKGWMPAGASCEGDGTPLQFIPQDRPGRQSPGG